jgi:Squalene/phytoene synthase
MSFKAIEFYQNHLDRVSRSFAMCIARLEDPLRTWVSMTYLICRILDTVEDAKWAKLKKQNLAFANFNQFIKAPDKIEDINSWVNEFPQDITGGEKLLLGDAEVILKDLHLAPESVKRPIQNLVMSMSAGMNHFANRRVNGVLKLNGLREVNQYCFFVAGIVGETLSHLMLAVGANMKLTKSVLLNGHHFGLFLQKVNLLKDQIEDEKEGRFLVPSKEELIISLKENAEGAFQYIESIPLEQKGYRLFCAWSLFLGLKSLPILQARSAGTDLSKITREETMILFNGLELIISNKQELRDLYTELMQDAKLSDKIGSSVTPAEDVEIQWLSASYQGSLDKNDFISLKMA